MVLRIRFPSHAPNVQFRVEPILESRMAPWDRDYAPGSTNSDYPASVLSNQAHPGWVRLRVLWVQLGRHADWCCRELYSVLPSVYSVPVQQEGQVGQGGDHHRERSDGSSEGFLVVQI
jgi:hypothetical protein